MYKYTACEKCGYYIKKDGYKKYKCYASGCPVYTAEEITRLIGTLEPSVIGALESIHGPIKYTEQWVQILKMVCGEIQ